MTEAQLLAAVRELCAHRSLLAYHTHDSRRSAPGFPDLVIVGGVVIFAELKSMSGKLTREQTTWRYRLIAAGQRWYCWRPADWFSGIIETTLREIA